MIKNNSGMEHNDSPTADREIFITRVFNAPRKMVFEAWTDPKQVVKWWGPEGFTTTSQQMDVRPGGTWTFTMHGPDGTDYKNRIVFTEIVEPEKLAYKHTGEEDTEHIKFQVVITFEEVSTNKTKMTMRSLFDTVEELREVVEKYGAIEGAKQHVVRLEQFLTLQVPAAVSL